MKISDKYGNSRPVALGDLTRSNLNGTLDLLGKSGKYDPSKLALVKRRAEMLIDENASISALSEVRGQVGADFVANDRNIETIYRGSGNYDTDRAAVATLPDGTLKVFLIEEKGGDSPSLGTRGVNVGGSQNLNAQQGSVAYGVDEFRSGAGLLQAVVDYDAKHGTHLAEDLVSGKFDFGYLMIHTEPGTNSITVTEFEPGPGQAFNLQHPGTGQSPPALPMPTHPDIGDINRTMPSAMSGTPEPFADEPLDAAHGPAVPPWAGGLVATAGRWFAGMASLARSRSIAPIGSPLTRPFFSKYASQPYQSLDVNIMMLAAPHNEAFDQEYTRVLTYASSVR